MKILGFEIGLGHNDGASVKLPTGETVGDWRANVEEERGKGYGPLVRNLLAHYNGEGAADTKDALQKTFPKTYQYMTPVTLPVLRKLVNERAQAFGGEGESFDWLPDDEDAEPDETFAEAVKASGFASFLKALDRRVEFCRRAFVRVTWDARDSRVRLSLFTPERVYPRWPADTRDMDAALGVLLEVEPIVEDGKKILRWEFWSPERAIVIDAKGRIDEGETGGENPYAYDGGEACVPLVSFGADSDDVTGYWQHPRADWLDTQRAVNVDETSRGHLAQVAGFGVWVSESTTGTADPWPDETVVAPAELIEVPNGRTLTNVVAQANLTGLAEASREHLNRVASLNDLPPGSVLTETRTVPSGTALAIERAPLMEAREDRVDAYRVPLARLAEVIRVVYNHHADGAQIPPGSLRWTPGDVTPPPDREAQGRSDETYTRIGTLSAVRILMRDEGLTRDEAIERAKEIEEEKRLVSARPATQGGGNPFARPPPSPLAGTSLLPADDEA